MPEKVEVRIAEIVWDSQMNMLYVQCGHKGCDERAELNHMSNDSRGRRMRHIMDHYLRAHAQ